MRVKDCICPQEVCCKGTIVIPGHCLAHILWHIQSKDDGNAVDRWGPVVKKYLEDHPEEALEI